LGAVPAARQDSGHLQAVEDLDQGLRVPVGLVDASRLELGRIEECIASDQKHDGHGSVAKRADLRGKPIDAAERIARAATGLEIALQVGHDRDAEARPVLLGLAAATQAKGQGQYRKEASHPPGSSNRAPGRKNPGKAAA
jgi:hypothetical protein